MKPKGTELSETLATGQGYAALHDTGRISLKAFLVNSFTDHIGQGNPAGVVISEAPLPDVLMQTIAFDVGKSETAFVRTLGNDEVAIRWFTPRREVPLCGHATLAAAKVLHNEQRFSTMRFIYAGGSLPVSSRTDGAFVMGFPRDDWEVIPVAPAYAPFFGGLRARECIRGKRTGKVALIVDQDTDLRAIRPDFAAMAAFEGAGSNGMAISKPSARYDFESRYFNPWYGVDEDPVTGSVHTMLAAYWGRALGKRRMLALQASQRPGELELELDGDMVNMTGRARVLIQGTLDLDGTDAP